MGWLDGCKNPRYLLLLLFILALSSLTPAAGAAPAPDYDNIVYTSPNGVDITLDIYLPPATLGDGPFPGLVVVHGGAFRQGSKEKWAADAERASGSGFVTYAIDYRLTCDPANPPTGIDPSLCGYRATAPVSDVQAAIQWVRANASTYRTDGANVGVLGGSAGGNIAGMAGMTGEVGVSKADVVASWSGEVKLPLRPLAPEIRYVGCKLARCPSKWDLASPHFFVDPSDAPIYLANSTDEIIPLQEATDFRDLCAAAGIPVELRILEGTRHERAYKNDVWAETMSFLHRYLNS